MTFGLGVVRELTVLAAAQAASHPRGDLGRFWAAVGHLLDLLEWFATVDKHVVGRRALVTIRGIADGFREALTAQVQHAHRALIHDAAAVAPLGGS